MSSTEPHRVMSAHKDTARSRLKRKLQEREALEHDLSSVSNRQKVTTEFMKDSSRSHKKRNHPEYAAEQNEYPIEQKEFSKFVEELKTTDDPLVELSPAKKIRKHDDHLPDMDRALKTTADLNELKDLDDTFIEPLLDPKNARDSVHPIKHQDMYQFYKKHSSLVWFAEEVDLTKDLKDWRTVLTDDERYYLKMILAFFAGSDFIVNEKEAKGSEVTALEYLWMCHDKMAREDIHSLSYANMLETYIDDPVEREHLKNAIKTIPSIKRKAEWFRKYIADGSFAERELAGAITEGIFFSGPFCGIFWMKKRGLMPGLCDYNELISRDEGIHRDFSTMIYRDHIVRKLPEAKLIQMVTEAVDIEIEFCTESLPVSLIGMNCAQMVQYIKFVADKLLEELIGRKHYKVVNPFPWMLYISLNTLVDFFAHRSTNYSRQKLITNPAENVIKYVDAY